MADLFGAATQLLLDLAIERARRRAAGLERARCLAALHELDCAELPYTLDIAAHCQAASVDYQRHTANVSACEHRLARLIVHAPPGVVCNWATLVVCRHLDQKNQRTARDSRRMWLWIAPGSYM
jgi:hypothetical protein